MRVCIEVESVSKKQASALESEIRSKWGARALLIKHGEEPPADTEALLVVGSANKGREPDGILLVERVDSQVDDIEALLFQVNAKLGRMTASDLAKSKVAISPNDGSARVSRRDLFRGLRGNLVQLRSDAPLVSTDACEAKYGCRKCLESCPSNAITLAAGTVMVADSLCTRTGVCTAVCPTAAIQLAKFSERAFLGMIAGMGISRAPKRVLVLTCDADRLPRAPWMYVEQVKDLGIVGPRLLALAASSGFLSGLIVYCADGACLGKTRARQAVESVKNALKERGERSFFALDFVEGYEGTSKVAEVYESIPSSLAKEEQQPEPRGYSRETWKNYTEALKSVANPQAPSLGLGLTTLDISNTCTLCGTCEKFCPHSALKIENGGRLDFDPSNCTGCGYCASLCPEKSITLKPLERLGHLERRRTVFEDEILNCVRCGTPLDTAAFLNRVALLADAGNAAKMINYCNSCKQQISFQKLVHL